jgi:hypothetical protein
MNTHRLIATLLATAAAGGAAATTASADSVAYIKSGNVYLAPGDLSREFQVTASGGYSAVSQADDGTLLATTSGGDLQRLDRFGDVLSDITTPVTGNDQPLSKFLGPFNADISPDGTKVAYGFVHSFWDTVDGELDFEQRNGAGFTSSTALTGFTDPGYTYSLDWDAPEWIDNQTVLVSDGPGAPSDPFAIETVGSGDPQGWFTDPADMHPLDATITRDHRLIAAVVGPDRQGLVVYRDDDGQLLGTVHSCFTYTDSGTYQYESPTFNGTDTVLYWSDGTHLESAPIGDMSQGCAPGQAGATSVTGTSPDWGPADVPTSRPTAPAPPTGPAPGPAPVPGPPTAPATRPAAGSHLTLLRTRRPRLAAALAHGLTLAVHAPASGRVLVTARVGHATVATGRARTRGGRVRVHLRFTPAARRRLTHHRRLALVLTVREGRRTTHAHLTLSR